MPSTRPAIMSLTALSALWPSSGFISTPSAISKQTTQLRRSSRFSVSSPWAGSNRSRAALVARRQRIGLRTAPFPGLTLGAGMADDDDVDPLEAELDIDPLDAGPDIVGSLLEDEDEGIEDQEDGGVYGGETIAAAPSIRKRLGVKASAVVLEEDDADAASMAALAAAAKDTAGKSQKKKKTRKRGDPFMPKGAPGPLDWREFASLKEGVRGHLVVFHTGFPKDQAVADSLIRQVKERFGDVVHVHEEFDDDEDTTEQERQESNAFEVWLEGPEVIVYHARGECNVDLTEEQMGKIIDDLETRVGDESILQIPCTKAPRFLIPGLTPLELQSRSYYPL